MDYSSGSRIGREDSQQLSADQAPKNKRQSRNSEQRQDHRNTHTLPQVLGKNVHREHATGSSIAPMSIATAGPLYNSHSSSDYNVTNRTDVNVRQLGQPSEYFPYGAATEVTGAPSSQSHLQPLSNHPRTESHFSNHHHPPPYVSVSHGFSDQQQQIQSSTQQTQIYNNTMQDQASMMHVRTHLTMRTPYIQPIRSRNPLERPVVKLSVNLIDTYKRINENYYKNKRRRENAQAAANAAAVATKPENTQESQTHGVHNHGWDDENYDYILQRGEVLEERYQVQERIGKGSFGQVVRAFDMISSKDVAIKIIKSKRPFLLQARTEIELLTHLKDRDSEDQHNIVRLLSHFMHKNHQCLVFEMLSLNLYELLKNTKFDGVSLNLIRKFAKQILKALQFLSRSDVDVIHCDLKPENILLKHPKRSGIKVIDFGSSCRSNNQMYSYIQSRFYRSPEVLLGLPYSVAIDMWSLGCILVEMHTGEPLFSGSDQFDQMQKIVKVLGMVPNDILFSMRDQQRAQFFEMGQDGQWNIKQREGKGSPILPSMNPRESLKTIVRRSGDTAGNYDVFIDMIHRMLSYRPHERISATEALQHPFIVAGEYAQTKPVTAA